MDLCVLGDDRCCARISGVRLPKVFITRFPLGSGHVALDVAIQYGCIVGLRRAWCMAMPGTRPTNILESILVLLGVVLCFFASVC